MTTPTLVTAPKTYTWTLENQPAALTLTVTAQPNQLILIFASLIDAQDDTYLTPALAGGPLSIFNIKTEQYSNNGKTYSSNLYVIPDPAPGTHNLQLTTAANAQAGIVHILSFKHVDLTAPIAASYSPNAKITNTQIAISQPFATQIPATFVAHYAATDGTNPHNVSGTAQSYLTSKSGPTNINDLKATTAIQSSFTPTTFNTTTAWNAIENATYLAVELNGASLTATAAAQPTPTASLSSRAQATKGAANALQTASTAQAAAATTLSAWSLVAQLLTVAPAAATITHGATQPTGNCAMAATATNLAKASAAPAAAIGLSGTITEPPIEAAALLHPQTTLDPQTAGSIVAGAYLLPQVNLTPRGGHKRRATTAIRPAVHLSSPIYPGKLTAARTTLTVRATQISASRSKHKHKAFSAIAPRVKLFAKAEKRRPVPSGGTYLVPQEQRLIHVQPQPRTLLVAP